MLTTLTIGISLPGGTILHALSSGSDRHIRVLWTGQRERTESSSPQARAW